MSTNTTKLLNRLLSTSAGQQIVSKIENKESSSERTAIAADLAALKAERDERTVPLQEERAKAEKELEALRPKWEKAERRARDARAEVSRASASFASRERTLVRKLLASAPPEVDALREWASEVAKETRRTGIQTKAENVRTFGGFITRVTHSNKASLTRRLAYLLSVTREGGLADEIALMVGREEIRQACEKVKEDLPVLKLEEV